MKSWNWYQIEVQKVFEWRDRTNYSMYISYNTKDDWKQAVIQNGRALSVVRNQQGNIFSPKLQFCNQVTSESESVLIVLKAKLKSVESTEKRCFGRRKWFKSFTTTLQINDLWVRYLGYSWPAETSLL